MMITKLQRKKAENVKRQVVEILCASKYLSNLYKIYQVTIGSLSKKGKQ